MHRRIIQCPVQRAETSGVAKAQAGSIVEHQIDMIVFCWRLISGQDAQATAHAQVQDCGALFSANQQVLGSPGDVVDDSSRQLLFNRFWYRPSKSPLPNTHGTHSSPDKKGLDAASCCLNLGQLGH